MSSGRVWFFAVAGAKHGPYSFEELRACAAAGRFSKSDYVWQPAFGTDWLYAGQVEGLLGGEKDTCVSSESTHSAVLEPKRLDNVPFAVSTREDRTIGRNASHPRAFASAVKSVWRTVSIFFRHSSLRRWCGIGFCVWLGGMSAAALALHVPSFNGEAKSLNDALLFLLDGDPEQILRMVESLKPALDVRIDRFVAFMDAPLAAVDPLKLALGLVFALWGLWLSCRGDVMLIHRWRDPDAPISHCWIEAIVPSNRLFRWRLMILALAVIVFGIWGRVIVNAALRDYVVNGHQFSNVEDALRLLFRVTSWAFLAEFCVLSILDMATDFVVPILEANPEKTMWQAWRAIIGVACRYPFRFLGYYVVKGILSSFWMFHYMVLFALSFGVAASLVTIPFFGVVFMAPLSLSLRGYAALWMNSVRPDLVPEPEKSR